MFKRIRWMSVGAAVGLGGSVWAQRRVRRTVERFLPDQVGSEVAQRARHLRNDVLDAIEEGRVAMQAREAELRAQLGVASPPARRPHPGADRGLVAGSSVVALMSPRAPIGVDRPPAAASAIPRAGRVLGLDLGSQRCGVAASDSAQKLAVGVETLARTGDPDRDREALRTLVEDYGAVGIVVGLPLSMSGRVGPAATTALAEADGLASLLGIPVETTDERLSTISASSALRAAGRSTRQQRRVVDRTAASVILQSWLDLRRNPVSGSGDSNG